ncbi:MAG TPA: TadE/TadG family type IV pilus assembly protein [Stellaceae bacterium]|nr:TadE/TadG family type IV pilus assembly protein [Stellaceae bacterium]
MRLFRRFARDRKGAVAVEMAMVGPPFLLVMLALLDFGQTLLTQSVLDGAARDAARLIRTGQVQSSGSPITTFQTLLCSDMSTLMSTATCDSDVLFEVQTFSSFGSVSFTSCTYNNNGTGTGTKCAFSPGNAGQIIGVQVSYARPYIVPWVGACLTGGNCWTSAFMKSSSAQGTQTTTLMSTVIFQNEPFGSS